MSSPLPRSFPQPPSLPPYPPPRRRWLRLLPPLAATATVCTTLLAGFLLSDGGLEAVDRVLADPSRALDQMASSGAAGLLGSLLEVMAGGLPYALGILAFFFAHEMGHYLACRWHRVDCTPPFFIPGPPPIGTFGAVIRIRSPFPNRRALFDIGIAGPLAGFAVMLPVLAAGILRLRAVESAPPPPGAESIVFGDSLLSLLLTRLLRPEVTSSVDLLIDPLFMAGWFGMLATVMNLIPAGQFDGGHVFYALFPRRHRAVSLASGVGLALLVLGYGLFARQVSAWTLWTLVVLLFGRRHPPVFDDGVPLGAARRVLALVVLLVFVLCFLPHPVGTISGPS